MSGTDQDGRLRLVPLVTTLAGIEEPALDLNQVFELAMKGEIRLYVRIPSDMVTYVDPLLPVVTHRRSSLHFPDASWRFSLYSPRFSQIHPEVTYVALDPDQAEELKATRSTEEMVFSSGLSPHPDSTLAQAEWWVPRQFGSSLVVCPALPAPTSEAELKRQRVRRTLLKTTPDDVYVDERFVSMLEDSHASIHDDPYYLRGRAPAVYVLFWAAKNYYAAMRANQITFEDVERKIINELSDLGKTVAKHGAKLINPEHKKKRGVPKKKQKDYDENLLSNPTFKATYKRATFVNDALALILYVTDQRLNSLHRHKADARNEVLSRLDVEKKLLQVGFHEKESEALRRIVMWPDS